MNNEDKQLAHIQKMTNEITKPIREMQKMIVESLNPIHIMQDKIRAQYTEILSPLQQIGRRYDDMWASILSNSSYINKDLSAINKLSETLIHTFTDSIANITPPSLTQTYAESIKIIAESALQFDDHTENDYVTVREDCIKEFDVPDVIAIPIGNNRIRIKTSIFVAIFIPIIIAVFNLVVDKFTEAKINTSETCYQDERLLIERKENQFLLDLISSIDASASSQLEAITEIKESLLTIESSLESLEPFDSGDQADHPSVSAQEECPGPVVSPSDNLSRPANTAPEE